MRTSGAGGGLVGAAGHALGTDWGRRASLHASLFFSPLQMQDILCPYGVCEADACVLWHTHLCVPACVRGLSLTLPEEKPPAMHRVVWEQPTQTAFSTQTSASTCTCTCLCAHAGVHTAPPRPASLSGWHMLSVTLPRSV